MRNALVLDLAIAVSAVGCGSSPADPTDVPRDPAVDGPWSTGVTTLTVLDDDGTELVVELWYPALPSDGEPEVTLGIPTRSVRDATADLRGGPFPLIAFSHGSGGVRVQSVYLTEHLASWGYVVVAPDHPHDVLGGSNDERPAVFRARPRQVSRAIDAALAARPDLIDASRIGVAGHSFGGFTALALAGGHVDVAALRASCTADPDQLACSGVDDALTQEVVDGFPDSRIAVAVALAPAGRIAFGDSGLAAIDVPTQIQGGTADTLATRGAEIEPMFDALTSPRSLGVIDRAAHFSFTDICVLFELSGGANGPLAFLATEGCGPETLPIERAHAASRTLAAAFFDVYLRGEPESDYLAGVPDAEVR